MATVNDLTDPLLAAAAERLNGPDCSAFCQVGVGSGHLLPSRARSGAKQGPLAPGLSIRPVELLGKGHELLSEKQRTDKGHRAMRSRYWGAGCRVSPEIAT